MTKAVFFILALSVLAGCGGAVQSAVPIQPKDSVIPVNPYLNASMIGQTWVFQNADATCTTTYRLKPAPSSSYFPAGSIVLNITKSSADCYWAYGTDQASIDFVLSPLADGSFNSLGWVAHFPGALPDWSPFHVYSQQVQTPAGAATPYMIVPAPTLDASSSIVIETTYDRWDFNGQNFNSFISGPPVATVYWKTAFYVVNGDAVSEQWEGVCGHEKWTFAPYRGLIAVEFPNDGSPSCPALPPNTSIHRVVN